MDKRRYLMIPLLCLALAFYLGRDRLFNVSLASEPQPTPQTSHPQRIVSLAPSLTEILFALDLGERVVGVTQYCDYPPAAANKPSIGGYLTPNYEAILRTRPDLILMLTEHEPAREALESLRVPCQMLDHRSVDGILASIRSIGVRTGADSAAEILLRDLNARINTLRRKTLHRKRPRVLICLGRKMGSGSIKDAYLAGRGSYFDDLLTRAGGQNAWQRDGLAYPIITAEGILRINPDIVIDMVGELKAKDRYQKTILAEWRTLSHLNAVKRQRIHLFTQAYATVPGPRFIRLLEDLARVLNPEVSWD